MTDTVTEQGSQTVGSILAVPTFIVVYLVAVVLVNVVMTFMNTVAGNDPTRWVELIAFSVSAFAAVYAGRWVLDKAFKAWSGWPTFVVVTALLILAVIGDWFFAPEPDWWLAALRTIQAVISIGAMWIYLIKRERIG